MRLILVIAIVFGISALSLDAFFAHGLKNFLGQNYSEMAWHALTTASRYQLTVSIMLLILIALYRSMASGWIIVSQLLAILGVLLFCVTIYLKHLFGMNFLANLAPLGGIFFMASFATLLPLIFAL